jgi:hypothetical protein
MRKQKENELKSTKLVASILNVDMKSIKAAVKTPMVHFEHNLIDLNQPIEGAAAVGVAAVGAAAAVGFEVTEVGAEAEVGFKVAGFCRLPCLKAGTVVATVVVFCRVPGKDL